jgi:hypothetical protein
MLDGLSMHSSGLCFSVSKRKYEYFTNFSSPCKDTCPAHLILDLLTVITYLVSSKNYETPHYVIFIPMLIPAS